MTSPPKRTRKAKRKRTAQRIRILRALPDTTGEVRAAICGSRSEAEDFIRQAEAICGHGVRCWLRVWRDDGDWWRCQLKGDDGATIAEAKYQHAAAAAEWLKEQWPNLD